MMYSPLAIRLIKVLRSSAPGYRGCFRIKKSLRYSRAWYPRSPNVQAFKRSTAARSSRSAYMDGAYLTEQLFVYRHVRCAEICIEIPATSFPTEPLKETFRSLPEKRGET